MSYGTNAPNGLVPVKMRTGAAWTGATVSYPITTTYATAIYKGDPVVNLADGTIGVGVAGSPILGVFWGVKYIDSTGTPKFQNYWPANPGVLTGSEVEALVITDSDVVFTVQETSGTGTAGTALALADRGLNANFLYTAGSSSTGISAVSLNNASENTTDSLNLKILDLDPTPGNVVGSYANWLVTINASTFRNGVTGI